MDSYNVLDSVARNKTKFGFEYDRIGEKNATMGKWYLIHHHFRTFSHLKRTEVYIFCHGYITGSRGVALPIGKEGNCLGPQSLQGPSEQIK